MRIGRIVRGGGFALAASLLFIGSAGCIDPFGGSNIQLTLAQGVHVPGLPADFGRPPPRTHYTFYGVNLQRDADGNVTGSTAFKVKDFEVVPVIDRASPCFIENSESRFPGTHSTQYLEKLEEVFAAKYGLSDPDDFDPFDFTGRFDELDQIDYLTAKRRVDFLGALQTSVKAVVPYSPAEYGDVDMGCSCDFDENASDSDLAAQDIPAATCLADQCAEKRTAICQAFWRLNPDKYEGNDEVFTLPHNGFLNGLVDGSDPRNNQFLGGSQHFVEPNLENIDALLMNWNFDCAADTPPDELFDCEPVYPDEFPDEAKSIIGYHYMSGTIEHRVRGVINVPMTNEFFGTIRGQAAIFVDLDDDDVHF